MKYVSILDILETQKAIEKLKNYFPQALAKKLNLTRVSAPLFVLTETGLNGNLNGVEEAVTFEINGKQAEIVHSLAKWKRYALKKYKFPLHSGIYTDMNAIRKDEILDVTHSYYVDQWDWEYIITKEERTDMFLETVVKKIYNALLDTENYITSEFKKLPKTLPKDIYFLTSQELEDMYPSLDPEEREKEICKIHKAVFVKQIGKTLKSGISHGGRSADYDDWELNGDILVWYNELEIALELSSMAIRVDKNSLKTQLAIRNEEHKLEFPYHKMILNEELPYTIGGGIGQSRLCMYLLKKIHIGEVQVSIWEDTDIELL